MSVKLKTLCTAQGVGSSASVPMDTTPSMAKHSAVAVIQPSTGFDRTANVEKSEDGGNSWTTVATHNAATLKFVEVQLSALMRVTVAGGATGTVSVDLVV